LADALLKLVISHLDLLAQQAEHLETRRALERVRRYCEELRIENELRDRDDQLAGGAGKGALMKVEHLRGRDLIDEAIGRQRHIVRLAEQADPATCEALQKAAALTIARLREIENLFPATAGTPAAEELRGISHGR